MYLSESEILVVSCELTIPKPNHKKSIQIPRSCNFITNLNLDYPASICEQFNT